MQTPTKPDSEVHIEEIRIEHELVTIDSSTREPESERKAGLARRTNLRGGLDTNQGP